MKFLIDFNASGLDYDSSAFGFKGRRVIRPWRQLFDGSYYWRHHPKSLTCYSVPSIDGQRPTGKRVTSSGFDPKVRTVTLEDFIYIWEENICVTLADGIELTSRQLNGFFRDWPTEWTSSRPTARLEDADRKHRKPLAPSHFLRRHARVRSLEVYRLFREEQNGRKQEAA